MHPYSRLPIDAADVASGVLRPVQSTWLWNASSFLRSPHMQAQPCPHLPPLSSSAGYGYGYEYGCGYGYRLSKARLSDTFSPSLTHAAINMQPSLHTVLYQVPGPFPPAHVVSRSPALSLSLSPYMTLLVNLWSSTRCSAPAHNTLIVHTVAWILSHPIRWRASL